MKRAIYASTALVAALLLTTALSKCSPARNLAPTVAPLRTAGNITADDCEVQAGWQNASLIMRFSEAGHIGEVVLIQGEKTLCHRAHCHTESPGVWLAEWGLNPENHIRLFANGHAEGLVDGQLVYFTPLGSADCLPE